MSTQLTAVQDDPNADWRPSYIGADTSSVGDDVKYAPVNVWGFILRNSPANDSQFTSVLPVPQDPSIRHTSSVSLTKTELEWDVSEDISDEGERTAEHSLFDEHDQGLVEYDLSIRMPPKRRFEVTLDVETVKKASPPKLDPDWLI